MTASAAATRLRWTCACWPPPTATSQASLAAGTFRQDLFYRLNVFPIQVPSLRERVDDIPLLVEYLIERYTKKAGQEAQEHSRSRPWQCCKPTPGPGNIRELQNVIERAVILCEGDTFSRRGNLAAAPRTAPANRRS